MAIKENKKVTVEKPGWTFTREQLLKFGQSINKYKKKVVLDGEEKEILDWDEIHFRAGVKTKQGAVTYYLVGDRKVFHIEKFEEMWRQYQAMINKEDYVAQKKLMTYASMEEAQAVDEFNKF